jgi:tRNA1Val (adenine37-N6)-methyltransferase
MPSSLFRFKKFTIDQSRSAFKVGTDGVLLGAYADINGADKILDIGTGTGLIAIMLAQRCSAEITGLEPDSDSFIEACQNVLHSGWGNRIKIENCKLQDYHPSIPDFDLIVTNPPYFVNSLKNQDPVKSATRHNILISHIEILEGAGRMLKEFGRLQIILPFEEGILFISEAAEYGFFCYDILKIKSLPSSKIKRMILGFSRERKVAAEKFLTIEKGKRHVYTKQYMDLTRDFYINF